MNAAPPHRPAVGFSREKFNTTGVRQTGSHHLARCLFALLLLVGCLFPCVHKVRSTAYLLLAGPPSEAFGRSGSGSRQQRHQQLATTINGNTTMGKPSDGEHVPSPARKPSHPHLGESASAISLNTTTHERYFDDPPPSHNHDDDEYAYADDDLPPLYSDHDDFASSPTVNGVAGGAGGSSRSNNNHGVTPVNPLVPRGGEQLVQPFCHSRDGTTTYYIDPRLDSDPVFLLDHITRLAALPPRPFMQLRGTHKERRRRSSSSSNGSNHGGSSSTETVVDFDLRIELTHLLYTDIHTQSAWRSVVTASNFEKVRRGTVFAERAPGFGGSSGGRHAPEEGTPDLAEWCRRYCAAGGPDGRGRGLRCFTLERRVAGWDFEALGRRLEELARATNYRGRVEASFPVRDARVEVHCACLTSRWRLTRWVRALFYATLLFLLAWPWLRLRTRRWDTQAAEWRASEPTSVPGRKRYAAGMSEERWYALWAGPLQRAMLERRQGELDVGDLLQGQGQGQQGQQGPRGGGGDDGGDGRAGRSVRGGAGAGGLEGVVRAGVEAMGVVNRSFGWGGDSC
ncbi:hypothetical protein JDV02_005782 [Purpureocillium takamizusanense]|uniref:Transmembrane protein n=1 Tax=Purpureocillium takamizusanense TaxID=2060973 RepID=A0A9Q8QH45_9HYPO|nr:uncharacterized protein JDV02_005782 [Purpureocillium takamizusanense]UNI19603.1 hypothetical protein JDV02_005782 [Purpureocillium takamizusanense]